MKHLALSLLFSSMACAALAEDCTTTIAANDAMQFDKKEIVVSQSCKEFTVNLTHSGKLPKNVMGHNWVLSKTDDKQSIASDGMTAGAVNNYLKVDDVRVIASTIIIGGGESTSVTFSVSNLIEKVPYSFFCSYPGHSAIMQGRLVLN